MVDLIRKPARCLGLCLAYNVIPRGFLWDRFCKSDYFVFRHDTFTKCSPFKWLKLAIKDIFQNNARSMTENIYQRLSCAQIAIKTKKKLPLFFVCLVRTQKATQHSMNIYPICDFPPYRSARRSLAPSQKSRQNHRFYVWTEALSGTVFAPAQKAIRYTGVSTDLNL